jgi:hypothetical protein
VAGLMLTPFHVPAHTMVQDAADDPLQLTPHHVRLYLGSKRDEINQYGAGVVLRAVC